VFIDEVDEKMFNLVWRARQCTGKNYPMKKLIRGEIPLQGVLFFRKLRSMVKAIFYGFVLLDENTVQSITA
jgi:hypothetical protein